MREGELRLRDGRTVGYADFGAPDGTPVLWCHGGPGTRHEAVTLAEAAADAGLRIIGIDRPGYGKSTPLPERTIGAWAGDGLAVADRLGLTRFATVGCSTGGAYSLALAAVAPARVLGVIACCALTDMRWAEGKARMTSPGVVGIWNAPDRVTAIAVATELMGADGSKMLSQTGDGPPLPPADLAVFSDPSWLAEMLKSLPGMFAHGVQGYVDDRRADGPGWGSFDVGRVTCPVTVLHGGADSIVPVEQAHHTAQIVPGAKLRLHDALGHFSIFTEVIPALRELLRR